jgi:uncharacterized protein
VQVWTLSEILAVICALVPVLAFGFAGSALVRACVKLPLAWRLTLPAAFGIPYVIAQGASLRGSWLALYLGLPILLGALLWNARQADPDQRGNWRDFAVLLLLGLAVDLRWFEPAWPTELRVINKLILLDSGLYGFLVIRQLNHVGFDLRIRLRDLTTGLRELSFYAPIAIPLGLWLGFLHFRSHMPQIGIALGTWLFTFFAIAIPEEIYFRGWLQNFLERRLGRHRALLITALIFGLAHFNRKSAAFNWRYVLLAAIAGIFYGRAWRQDRRVAASAITHSFVDTIWSLWL